MDELWNYVRNNFHLCLPYLPEYEKIVESITSMNFKEIPNLLLHGCNGIPFNLIWNIALHNKFGEYTKSKRIWGKELITYYETPYFFEIDLLYPHQTKDMVLFSEFIKEIISHPCIHEDRHIIILENLDQISDKLRSTALRVLLERYSKNAFFICTTSYIGQIESPIRSRFLNVRCPIFTITEIESCFKILDRTFHPLLKEKQCHDFYFALFISWLNEYYPDKITESLCHYTLPFFHEFLLDTIVKEPTIEEIRKITQKISIENASFNMIAQDLLLFYKDYNDEFKTSIISYSAKIDHMCSMTEEYRKPLYIEYLLNIIFNNVKQYKHLKSIENHSLESKINIKKVATKNKIIKENEATVSKVKTLRKSKINKSIENLSII